MNTLLCEYIIDCVIMFIPYRTRTIHSSDFGDFRQILLIGIDLVVARADFVRVYLVIVRDNFVIVKVDLVLLEICELNYNGVHIFCITMVYNVMVL